MKGKLPFPIIMLLPTRIKEPVFLYDQWIKPAPLTEPLIGAVLNREHRRQFPWLWRDQVRKYVTNGKIPDYEAILRGEKNPQQSSGMRRGRGKQ